MLNLLPSCGSVNSNGENVVANNLNHTNFCFIFEKCQIFFFLKSSYVFFSEGYHNCQQNKTPHIIYLTYEH
jgi:hypothetical protein